MRQLTVTDLFECVQEGFVFLRFSIASVCTNVLVEQVLVRRKYATQLDPSEVVYINQQMDERMYTGPGSPSLTIYSKRAPSCLPETLNTTACITLCALIKSSG
jgi:hypothetical protein